MPTVCGRFLTTWHPRTENLDDLGVEHRAKKPRIAWAGQSGAGNGFRHYNGERKVSLVKGSASG